MHVWMRLEKSLVVGILVGGTARAAHQKYAVEGTSLAEFCPVQKLPL
jgi:hypothetical protein